MITEATSEYLQYYPHVDTVDVATEKRLAADMDAALTQLIAERFVTESHLNEILDRLITAWPYDEQADEINTLVDLASVAYAFPDSVDLSFNEIVKQIASLIMASSHDRHSLIDYVFETLEDDKLVEDKHDSHHQQYLHARNQLVQANMRLVIHLARRYSGKGVEVQELVQDGTLGLIKATERYNLNKGFRFTTYAYWWIQQAIKESLSDKRGLVRLPGNINERILKIERSKQQFFQAHGRYPNAHEVQTLTQLDPRHIEAVGHVGNLTDSMHESVFEEGLSMEETLGDDCDSPEMNTLDVKQNQFVETLIGHLPKRQQFILRLYHGVGIGQTFPFKEIAPQLGITLERTRQLYHESIKTLRELTQDSMQEF